jgi:1,2-diacylglycerol 3-alpha-glucosyltransferase
LRIAHLCLSCFYLDNQSYQENELVRHHVEQKHDVLVIASTDVRTKDGQIYYCEEQEYIGSEGAKVIRMNYISYLPKFIASKLRIHSGLSRLLANFRPDAILFHGTCGWEVITAARYAKEHPEVFFYIDSHEDKYNSARSFLSRELLHKVYYRYCLSRAWPIAKKIFCVSTESMDFVEKTYGVPKEKIEFFPLGGKVHSDQEYGTLRDAARKKLGLRTNEILFVQAGKQTTAKKLLETLRAFNATPDHAKLVIAGTLDKAIESEAMSLIKSNSRISYLGWQSVDEMTSLLCAADVYLQPGTQSVTMQNSLCCRCVPIIANAPSHKIFVSDNGWLVDSQVDFVNAILAACASDLSIKSLKSLAVATRLLDYDDQSKRVLR